MSDQKLFATRKAADKVGVSMTHFMRLAEQQPRVVPIVVEGSGALVWTGEQVDIVKGRVKR
jgi:hypothetical protein